jgi:hypothetical protein
VEASVQTSQLLVPDFPARTTAEAAVMRVVQFACGATLLFAWAAVALSADSPPTAAELKFFETSVRPLLVEHCQKCHGTAKQWAGLRLDSRADVLKGGESGPAAVSGQPAESLLLRAVKREADVSAMPPDKPLSAREVNILAEWIKQGLPYPAAATTGKPGRDPNHWAFQPITSPELPVVQDTGWSRTGIDRFILAKLEAAGQHPTGQADKRTLIRRLTFDLTGLPPTPDEIVAFLADEAPAAEVRLVDRLLASPAYGERWGRHWLDVARYADSNGLDENVAHGNAWRYRDYVVNAFNADLPFDQFLKEQLAGDLLAATDDATRERQLIATGFLAIGPKVLAEVDETRMQMDIVDEQLETVGRAFLGMTFGCCRCHDHKFDPLSTADYYGLAGIFKSTRAMEHYKKVARWQELPLPSPATRALLAEHAAKIAEKHAAIEATLAQATSTLRQSQATDQPPAVVKETDFPAETQQKLAALRKEVAQLEKTPPDVPTAMAVKDDAIADVPIHIRGNPLKLGDMVPRHVPAVLTKASPPSFTAEASGRRELAEWMTAPQQPLTARVIVNRVWRWHFGRGLVASTDNFGLLGDAPSHPELLDWLAQRLMQHGWSLKALHRELVLSATYQQSSHPAAELVTADPENRLWGRMPVRRLEAEAIRDAMLAVSDRLDLTLGGSLLTVKNRAYFFDHTSKDLTNYDSPRRSLYLPVVRNNLYDVFQLLDYPDAAVPTGDRPTTTVAPQALLMMNSPFVLQAAHDLAAVALAAPGPDVARLSSVFVRVYGRSPSAEESQRLTRFLQELQPTVPATEAWVIVTQLLLASNEFSYVP